MKTTYAKPITFKSSKGFTIVELLIVIVIIGILAGISIVAYTGMQERSRNMAIERAVSDYVKALGVYRTEYGTYPTTTSTCMGAVADYRNGGCMSVASAPAAPSATFETELKKVISPLPKPDNNKCYTGWGACRRNFTHVYIPRRQTGGLTELLMPTTLSTFSLVAMDVHYQTFWELRMVTLLPRPQ